MPNIILEEHLETMRLMSCPLIGQLRRSPQHFLRRKHRHKSPKRLLQHPPTTATNYTILSLRIYINVPMTNGRVEFPLCHRPSYQKSFLKARHSQPLLNRNIILGNHGPRSLNSIQCTLLKPHALTCISILSPDQLHRSPITHAGSIHAQILPLANKRAATSMVVPSLEGFWDFLVGRKRNHQGEDDVAQCR
jgi:hypothetical protein